MHADERRLKPMPLLSAFICVHLRLIKSSALMTLAQDAHEARQVELRILAAQADARRVDGEVVLADDARVLPPVDGVGDAVDVLHVAEAGQLSAGVLEGRL